VLCTCDGFALLEDDPDRVEICWSCNILIGVVSIALAVHEAQKQEKFNETFTQGSSIQLGCNHGRPAVRAPPPFAEKREVRQKVTCQGNE